LAEAGAQQVEWKRAVAQAAAKLVENGMVVGLGSGSTALLWVEALGRRIVEEKLDFVGIPSSDETEEHARRVGIQLTTFAEHRQLDLDVDGADEIELGTLNLIKGLGGALLREKVVASASKRMVVIGDESKIVPKLGTRSPVPVEVVRFGWEVIEDRLKGLGAKPALRMAAGGTPFVTDGGNYILDCAFGLIENPTRLAREIDRLTGTVEHGLFLGFATEALVSGPSGIKNYKKTG
jgi:ribose 5-phosphate isomerase A